MANQGKRMVKENLIAQIGQGGGGSTYTAGTGIDITEDVISVDNTIATKEEVDAVDAKTLSIYGLGVADLPEGSTTFDLPIADLIAAGLPILSNDYTTGSDYIYKDNVVDIKTGSYFYVSGLFALATDTLGGLRFYITSNNGLQTNKDIYTIEGFRTGGKEYTFNNARYRARLSAWGGILDYVHDMIQSTDGIVGISGNPDNEPVNITYTYMTVNNPEPNVRYRSQLALPSEDGNYALYATVDSGLAGFSWGGVPISLPPAEGEADGTYVLKATVEDGYAMYEWVLDQA